MRKEEITWCMLIRQISSAFRRVSARGCIGGGVGVFVSGCTKSIAPIPTDSIEVVSEGIASDERMELILRRKEGVFPKSTTVYAERVGEQINIFLYPHQAEVPVHF